MRSNSLYAVTGVTGNVGGAVAQTLLAQDKRVRAIGRDASKLAVWAEQGCEIALATNTDAAALAEAFNGVEALFLMVPPLYDPEPGFPTVHEALNALRTAIDAARPGRVVFLSTVGAHVARPNLLNALKIMEEGLRTLETPITFLRAAWFMENSAWDVNSARAGLIPSYLQPLDHPIPMIATEDIGQVAAELMQVPNLPAVVELEAERRYSANDIVAAFSEVLRHTVKTEAIPRDTWVDQFRAQGMRYPEPRIAMIDGFNEGWIDFEGGDCMHRTGSTPLVKVLRKLVAVR